MSTLNPVMVDGHVALGASGWGNHEAVFIPVFGQCLVPILFAVRHFGFPCRVSVKGNDVPVKEEAP